MAHQDALLLGLHLVGLAQGQALHALPADAQHWEACEACVAPATRSTHLLPRRHTNSHPASTHTLHKLTRRCTVHSKCRGSLHVFRCMHTRSLTQPAHGRKCTSSLLSALEHDCSLERPSLAMHAHVTQSAQVCVTADCWCITAACSTHLLLRMPIKSYAAITGASNTCTCSLHFDVTANCSIKLLLCMHMTCRPAGTIALYTRSLQSNFHYGRCSSIHLSLCMHTQDRI